MIPRLVLQTFLLFLVLPSIGLLEVDSDVNLLVAALFVAVAMSITNLLFLPWFVSNGDLCLSGGAFLGDHFGIFLIYFIASTWVTSIALWLASGVMASVVLYSFWQTILAGAVLSLVSTLFPQPRS